ncbi:MAG: hypothetical protein DI551_00650 [Micavibrio aeruginosavorus]|uniref:HTH cro/C1-type domain-containing protein n=1 Tax=Micavibrio aeruginosavorus TaxID=349221 RepID=A0A2W5Q288_9BACT|nr:MAG: hypothetical protein DI551_00650 [Micavibrio aeruginosavorus]
MATGKQIAAARALAGWDQKDLAARAGLTQQTISNIEAGGGAQAATLQKIHRAFAPLGISITPTGISQIEPDIITFEDFMDVLADARVILKRGQDICFHCADDRRSDEAVTEVLRALEKDGIKLRFTYEEGNSFFSTSPANYRWIPAAYFASAQVQVIYADRVVIHIEGDGGDKFVVIRNKDNAAAAKKQFDYWWKTGQACG